MIQARFCYVCTSKCAKFKLKKKRKTVYMIEKENNVNVKLDSFKIY